MDQKITYYLTDMVKEDEGAPDFLINEVQNKIDFKLPPDYLSVMKEFNGGEGGVGENSWLNLFPFQDLIETNHDYRILMQDIPEYFLFGKDAADTGYAFHKVNHTYHSFGLMSNFETDSIVFCGNSFAHFLEYLYNK